ncbi:carph-isopro domain-containing protein [Mesorhizobium sp. BE184]|uniref:transcriptional regulator n=1 Tax=Mesorhizobium sp. BE184 TaxID=2817714 RepID=UPI00285F8B85|nr:YdaS family helix-turn-helix protein [Mesorhizobium sp. BE184]MDR7035239.1 DNA-binding transcriptional regulator YdaS (Cro superfamily) [Mesorhizobium sp. BE184]
METTCSPVDRFIDALGGLTKAAASLGIENPSVVANWRTRGRVPAEHVLKIEAETGISRHELRPDIFGTESATPAPEQPSQVEDAA